MFAKFIADEEALDMFITGAAGTGKTTGLHKNIDYCVANDIPYVVCAFTHKACDILRSKLPEGARVQTLHSFLRKRPTINVNANCVRTVESNQQHGAVDEEPRICFVDEYSMVGQQDKDSMEELQEVRGLKVVWIGDPHQLPPVGDEQGVRPYGKYQKVLTKVYRNDNELLAPLTSLVSFITGESKPYRLEPNSRFHRDIDIVDQYKRTKIEDKVILAFTNKRVQSLNTELKGRDYLESNDDVFSPSNKHYYRFENVVALPGHCVKWNGEVVLANSKYRTLETLMTISGVQFGDFTTEDGELITLAYVFGHYDYKVKREELKALAVEANQEVEKISGGMKAAQWCRENSGEPLARKRAKAWREFLSFDDCVVCIDFPFAMTVHKSQGSTYNTVFVDIHDIAVCQDLTTMFKLTYVAISRASNEVYAT